MKKTLLFLTALSLTAGTVFADNQKENVNIYTYDSFTSDWGAGPKLKQAFEQNFPRCVVNYMPFESGGTLFNRVRLERHKTKADIVLGLDNFVLDEAKKSNLFDVNKVDLSKLSLPSQWADNSFLPYDFGTYAFVYDKNKLKNPPKSLKELVEREDLRVIYQDPRTSSVGRGLLVWMNAVYPAEQVAQAWQQLAKHTVTVGKGWSDTYGAFLKGEADLVLSYSTSPLYHQLSENKDNYAATEFAEGNLTQVELAARIAEHKNQCADQFMDFLITPEAQKHIVTANVMLPVIHAPVEPHFNALKEKLLRQSFLNTSNVTPEALRSWISQWQTTLTQ
ncbi:thiamine ABC transporter substrate binding subunit [Aggregatibacter actinomycetemcomitans]|uniref:thiamine ABC transporter substrate binding subunit n=1 Tax=Aggregatibacter actinomycetemcomitans TaxID=714 RepID=UPI000BA1AECE|nr:thiamine ABC transporter substrate binding subunit [Aggregatibacter actinomycetemcomitans]OZV18598.1 thiamine ABC transporter substrate binding subunit [Aggregatibacter actinomycetemcomitans]